METKKLKAPKLYNIVYSRSGRSSSGRESETGFKTLDELKSYFGYTLEIGRSWNQKIKHPNDITTIKQFMTALEKSYGEKEANCYDRTSLTLIEQ
jgi:hypothetical protein